MASFRCLWTAFGAAGPTLDSILTLLGALGLPLGVLWPPLDAFGSLWSALGLPLAALSGAFGRPGPY